MAKLLVLPIASMTVSVSTGTWKSTKMM